MAHQDKTGKAERERLRGKEQQSGGPAPRPERASPGIHKLGGALGIQQGGGQKAKQRQQ